MRARYLALTASLASAVLALSACGGTSDTATGDTTYQIGISQFVTHPSLDAAREGFKAAVNGAGLKAEFEEQNAQGDQATATSIANNFTGKDLVLAVATPSAQAAAQVVTTKPVLFTAVTDPVAAGLVKSLDAPGANVTGTSDLNPVKEQIDLVKEIVPDAKTVGIVYSSGEVNSEVQVKLAKEAAAAIGLEVRTQTVSNSGEVAQAARSLDVDAFYLPTDNVVVSAIESVLGAAETKKVPVVAGEGDSVKRGAVATFGIDYRELGQQTGNMAVRVLRDHADVAAMAVETQKDPKLIVNTQAAKALGVTLPQDLVDRANEVVSTDAATTPAS